MGRKYPVFTDGERFFHSSSYYPKGCRFAYFSDHDFIEWMKKEFKKLTKEKAKSIWDNWESHKLSKSYHKGDEEK